MHLERNRVPMKYCDLKERCLGSRAPGKEKREVKCVPNQNLRACVGFISEKHWEVVP